MIANNKGPATAADPMFIVYLEIRIAHFASLEVVIGLNQFFAAVHDERSVLNDGLIDRFTAQNNDEGIVRMPLYPNLAGRIIEEDEVARARLARVIAS